MNLSERITEQLAEATNTLASLDELLTPHIAATAECLVGALMSDRKILACGNGAGAALAQHFAAEMIGRFEKERPGLAAIALTPGGTLLTAITVEYDYDFVFSKQIRALGKPGDMLLVIAGVDSTANLLEAVHAAHERQMTVVALTDRLGGKIAELLTRDDIQLNAPTDRAARVVEAQLTLLHCICDAIDFILLDGE